MTQKQKIVPHLWFDKEANEAAEFYVSAFGRPSKILNKTTLQNTPSGDTEIISFKLLDTQFMSMSAGPLFTFNPSVSFFVNFDASKQDNTRKNLDRLWDKLIDGGKALMELGEYPFSKHYGWLQDKYGLSWQLILSDSAGDPRPAIMPSLLFTKNKNGQAKKALNFYLSVFKNSKNGLISTYNKGQAPNKNAKVAYADFMIENFWMAAMDSAIDQNFEFNEAISFIIKCQDQAEIDYYWEKLSAVPEAEQCGWLQDKYGISWQIIPWGMQKLMENKDQKKVDRVTRAFLQMKKIDLEKLERAAAS